MGLSFVLHKINLLSVFSIDIGQRVNILDFGCHHYPVRTLPNWTDNLIVLAYLKIGAIDNHAVATLLQLAGIRISGCLSG